MQIDIFDIIDYKLSDIMSTIEIKMPLLMNDIPQFIENKENKKLYDIYLKISELRSI